MIAKPSTNFEVGDIVRVPFPYVERDRSAVRPALVISRPLGRDGDLIWTIMITSARRGAWPGDVAIGDDHADYGLPVPCFIRTAKIAPSELSTIDCVLGRLPPGMLHEVQQLVRSYLA